MLQQFCEFQLKADGILESVVFQQNGAFSHFKKKKDIILSTKNLTDIAY